MDSHRADGDAIRCAETGKAEAGPLLFGPEGMRLFGYYHVPREGTARQTGAVICPPLGHEHIAAHRALRQLAVLLCDAGFHVLRFDLYGNGDSDGASGEGGMGQWVRDIDSAVSTLRSASGLSGVCLFGLRLGATLAAIAGAGRPDIDGLALWDPVTVGADFLGEMKRLHFEVLRDSCGREVLRSADEEPAELLGFPLTPSVRRDLGQLDLRTMDHPPARSLLLVETDERTGRSVLEERLASLGLETEMLRLPTPKIWIETMDRPLVPRKVLQAIVSWAVRVLP